VEGVYFQEYIEGMPCAAVYIATKSQVFLLGITRQLIGEPFLQAKQFQYCGSVGPLFPASENKERLELGTQEGGLKEPNSRRSKNAAGELDLSSSPLKPFILLGNALAKDFALRGLFGVDCVLCDGIPYPVEVNPRYTASVEVLELATGQSAVESHRLAFVPEGPGILPLSSLETESKFGKGENQHVVAKGVLFARDTFLVPSQCPWNASLDQPITGFRDFADIPHAGTRIDKGSPIVSIFARAKTVEQCLAALRVQAQRLDLRLFGR
jgi:predicted ATP-grasp superfamily ATP-dependent carboligase